MKVGTEHRPEKGHEPPISITKRSAPSLKMSIAVRAIAIAAAILVCVILTVIITKLSPWEFFKALFEANFGNPGLIMVSMQELAILLLVSLAVTPAFRMKFWNCGAEGQVLAGSLASAFIMLVFGNGVMNDFLLLGVALLSSILAGALWGLLPAVFKAQWNTNETLFTLMMNYVAMQLVSFFIKIVAKDGSNVVDPTILKFSTASGDIFTPTSKFWIIAIVAVIITVVLYIYLNYTKHGYEISVVGESENTAKYIGINVKKVIIRTMLISGALCGIVGFMLVSVKSRSINPDLAGGRGFTAIMVSWLAKFNPIFMILVSFLLTFMRIGTSNVIETAGFTNQALPDILIGIILFFIIGCEFFLNYKVRFNFKKHLHKQEVGTPDAKTDGGEVK